MMRRFLDDDGALAARYGNGFLLKLAPLTSLPETGMAAADAERLVSFQLELEGDPQRNLATFATTWMEPEAQRLIARNLHRNVIDHAEYPETAEIERGCIRMLADLFHAPGETTGADPGIVGGDHPGRALAQMEMARAAHDGAVAGRPAEPGLRRRRPRRSGRSSAATSTSSRVPDARDQGRAAHQSERRRVKTGTGY